MKRTVFLWELVGFGVTSLAGTLLHFLYDWLGEASWIAPFSGVNESTFEHMKLMFWPMLFYAVFESFFFREYKSFWCVKLRGTLIGLALIPLIFYTWGGVIGKPPDLVNISIFFVSAAIAYLYQARALNNSDTVCASSRRAKLLFAVIALMFVIFTFKTPRLAIFKDPLTGQYGIIR